MRPLSYALAFACAAALVACLIGRDDYFFGSALTVARWPLAAALVLLAFRLKRAPAIAAVLVALAATAHGVAVSSAQAQPAPLPPKTTTLSVLTHNVLFKGARPSQSLSMLKATPAELAVFQEVTPDWEAALDAALLPSLPHKAARAHAGAYGYAVYSRWPISKVSYLPNRHGLPHAQCFTLSLPELELPVCNVHLSSPAGPLLLKGLARVNGLEANAERRAEEWAAVETHFGDARHRLVLGDLNTLEVEPLYETITSKWVDVWSETHAAPRGTTLLQHGATWPHHFGRLRPFARIDYVLTSGAIHPQGSRVPAESGSDHLAVTAQLTLAAEPLR